MNRSHLRYSSELTDDEWKLVAVDPARQAQRRQTPVIMREVVNGLSIFSPPVVSGEPSRKTCRRARRCTIISTCEVGIARSISYIMSSM
jgi:hypothetical protein